MNYFLAKSEPQTYSWERFLKEKKCSWDGVRNYAARNTLRAMQEGDLMLFYHSGEDKCVKGIAKVKKTAYPDPTAPGEDWSAVDLVPFKTLKNPVPLSAIRADKRLTQIMLVRQGRLSVMSLKQEEFDAIVELGS